MDEILFPVANYVYVNFETGFLQATSSSRAAPNTCVYQGADEATVCCKIHAAHACAACGFLFEGGGG